MFPVVLLAYLSYRNGLRARLKGLNGLVWTGLTACAFVAALMVGMSFVIAYFCGNVITLTDLSKLDYKARMAESQHLAQVIDQNPLNMVTILMFGVGGYLLVRYILERRDAKGEAIMPADKGEQ